MEEDTNPRDFQPHHYLHIPRGESPNNVNPCMPSRRAGDRSSYISSGPPSRERERIMDELDESTRQVDIARECYFTARLCSNWKMKENADDVERVVESIKNDIIEAPDPDAVIQVVRDAWEQNQSLKRLYFDQAVYPEIRRRLLWFEIKEEEERLKQDTRQKVSGDGRHSEESNKRKIKYSSLTAKRKAEVESKYHMALYCSEYNDLQEMAWQVRHAVDLIENSIQKATNPKEIENILGEARKKISVGSQEAIEIRQRYFDQAVKLMVEKKLSEVKLETA